jgi:HPt (histidine-containing phosphotransfer) domain-containing protein
MDSDYGNRQRLAHAIKGASLNIGAERLSVHAAAQETSAIGTAAWAACDALRVALQETLVEWRRSGWLAEDSGMPADRTAVPSHQPR